ncbi:MAG: L-2-hydroxyglutarate oxidase [Saprospiraceae bacterium]|nr:L-2-hydroxyglutarate oxidase [Saprospiraceae bacterium]
MKYDVIIIGAGIVGLATALRTLQSNPRLRLAILEKESEIALHQTGHNSGVIHSGIYYKPGSQKAQNCINGYNQLIQFCDKYDIKYDLCGKIIVKTKESQSESFNNIYNRGVRNGLVGITKISKEQALELEPHVNCLEAIYVPQTGIIDFKKVSLKYTQLINELGGELFLNNKVVRIKNNKQIEIITDKMIFTTKTLVNCAGLYSDKIAKFGAQKLNNIMIIPFRGEYYELNKDKEYLVKNLIYPVPNPNFPFLGVHFTRMINGGIEAGPNAVLAFRREGYKKTDINFKELFEVLTFPGFRKVAFKYWAEGWMEMKRSYSKKLIVKAMKELIPEIEESDVHSSGSGVRAQACDIEGTLLDDFKIIEMENIINVCNAPSPAATSSLSIGEHISKMIINRL